MSHARPHALLLLALAGCDPVVVDDPELEPSVLVLPVVGVDVIEAVELVQTWPAEDGVAEIGTTSAMNLGFGPAYPSELTREITGLYHVRCGELSGRWQVERATSSDEGTLRAELDAAGALGLQVLAPGTSTVVVHGTYIPQREECTDQFENGVRYQLRLQYDVTVLEPAGSLLLTPGACGESDVVRAVSGAPLMASLGVFPVDGRGDWIGLQNAVPRREVELRITAPEGGTVVSHGSDEMGLGGVRFEGAAGMATVEPSVGDAFDIQVVSQGELTSVDVQFTVPWGRGRSDLIIEDGGTYGEHGWAAADNVIEPRIVDVRVGDDSICSDPRSDWFELLSATPDTCAVGSRDGEQGWKNWSHFVIEPLAEIQADGRCALTLEAPAFNGGAGSEVSVAATLLNTDSMNPRE